MSVKYRRKFSQSPLKLSRGGFKISSSIRAGFLEGVSDNRSEMKFSSERAQKDRRPVVESLTDSYKTNFD